MLGMKAKTRSILFFSLCIPILLVAQRDTPSKEFIFTIAPFPSCHASTIIELRNGDLLAAWFGGTAEGKPDVAIWGARRASGHWSTSFVLVRERDTPTWNPVLFHSKDRRLWLYYKLGSGPRSWSAARMWSDDEGKTWSQPEHLPPNILGPIKDKPLVLDDGTIVSGSSVETPLSWTVWIERSTDNGKSWSRIGPITVPSQDSSERANSSEAPYGIIQPTIVSMGGNRLRFYARSSSSIERICVADSEDGGLTWSQARPINVPNPNSGIDAVRLHDGRIILAYNNTTSGRTPLNLAISSDGENFRMFASLETQPGEYSYPAIIQASGGDLLVTYTWNRTRISFTRFPLAEIPR